MVDIQIQNSSEIQGEAKEEASQKVATGGKGCSCGGTNDGIPEVDVQTIPHSVRHDAIFGMLDGLEPGSTIILSATHNPIPLIKQLKERSAEMFETEYLEKGPDRWKLSVSRNKA